MGYTKIIQYGDTIETFQYSRSLSLSRRKTLTAIQKKRAAERRKLRLTRSPFSCRRSVQNFFQLVHHNVYHAKTISFCTLTFANDYSHKQASRYVSHFFHRIKKTQIEIPIYYISVPEFTKKGRIHYHLLIFNLPPGLVASYRDARRSGRFIAGAIVGGIKARADQGCRKISKGLGLHRSAF